MRFGKDKQLIFSPSDLTNFMESRFSSHMDRLKLQGDDRATPDLPDESIRILQERGVKHEMSYLQNLRSTGANVREIPADYSTGIDLTLQAMQDGCDYIYQAQLYLQPFFGKCDFLKKCSSIPSPALGISWSYVPCDTKLALKAKPYFAIQLCCYAEILQAVQGVLPAVFAIILGDGSIHEFRTEEYLYFFQHLKKQFLNFHHKFVPDVFPEDIELPPFSQWKTIGEKILQDRDDLCFVANARKSQIVKLKAADIHSLTVLANTTLERVERMSDDTFNKLRRQAKLQLDSKGLERPLFELQEPDIEEPRRGLALLPPSSANDVWFDMEGYPHVPGGLEYLFGAVYKNDSKLEFFECWAHDSVEEKAAFERFIDWVYDRWLADRTMHIYHYAAYETSALRRLMGKFGSRELELDHLLRNNVFIDLYTVVRQSLIIGEPRYSIKNVEHLYRGKRGGDVSTAMDSVVWYYKWLELKDGADHTSSKLLGSIRQYNIEDCESTYELDQWLRQLQNDAKTPYIAPPSVAIDTTQPADRASQLAAELISGQSSDDWKTRLIAYLLNFHRREDKPIWWGIFDKRDWKEQDLYDDLDCLSGLVATQRWAEKSKRSMLFEFSFDADQESKIDKGDTVCFYKPDGSFESLTVKEVDFNEGRIALVSGKIEPPKRINIVKKDLTGLNTISESIYEIASAYRSGAPLPQAFDDFLERRNPRLLTHTEGSPLLPDDTLDAAIDVIRRMDQTTLCIQGPPGCGKTYLAARAIMALLAEGKKIGITSNSHKAIELLINEVGTLATAQNYNLKGCKIGQDPKEDDPPSFTHEEIMFYKDPLDGLGYFPLVAATAYAFAKPEAIGTLDYLFVDEAGQVAVANLMGIARVAKNIILLGDQMQLEQPVRGSHPEESGLSILQYYLRDHATVPPEKGIFLSTTRRMHPEICTFVSSAVYDGRLSSHPSTAQRELITDNAQLITKSAGIMFHPVVHNGCVQSSPEEVQAISQILADLGKCQLRDGPNTRLVSPQSDVLIMAPYNKQVRLLKTAFPGHQIGTVDKFQGKEKPIIILSMADSNAAESARGLEFLFSKNRLNVALSRAETLAIVVANPRLTEMDCNSLFAMSLINIFCRIVQDGLAKPNMTAAAVAI